MANSNGKSTATSQGLLKSTAAGDFLGRHGVLVFLTALIALNGFVTPGFLSMGTMQTTLIQVFPVVLVALGMTLVISSGGIDISVGAVMAISAAVSARLHVSGIGLAPSIGCGIVAAALCGLFNGVLISKCRIQPIIVTLVVMIAGRGLAMRIQGDLVIDLEPTPFGEFGSYDIADRVPVQIAIMFAAVAVMLFLVKQTVFAKHVEAIGDNPRAARLVGINTLATTIGVYVVCGILCGVAGNMDAARTGAVDVERLGVFIELDAIAAVAIGGTAFSGGRARIIGTVVGALVVYLVTVIVDMNDVPSDYSMLFKALIVVVAMWVQRKP